MNRKHDPPSLWAMEPEDDLEAIRAASAANVAGAGRGRVEAWLEEMRGRREARGLASSTPRVGNIPREAENRNQPESKRSQPHFQNKGAKIMNGVQKEPRTIDDLFPSPWLRAGDLKKPVTVKIARAELVDVYDKRSGGFVKKLALSFTTPDGKLLSKELLVNKTNAYALADICGTKEFGRWPGHLIILAPGHAANGKKTILVRKAVTGKGGSE